MIEIDETAPTGPAMYPPYWPPLPATAGQLPLIPAAADIDKDETKEEAEQLQEPAVGDTVERRQLETKGRGPQGKVFEDNMMDYVREKPEKDEDQDDDDDRKRKKKKKSKQKKKKKKKKKPKRKRQKKSKQKRKQRQRRSRRKKRQQKRRQ